MNDDDIERMLDQNPLLEFSLYTHSQANTLGRIGREIIGLTNTWESDGVVTEFHRAYDLFWLWVLGAYEMIRTMHQYRSHFSNEIAAEIISIKSIIAEIRMPFAKQEMRYNSKPIYAELSVYGFSEGLNFNIKGKNYNSTRVIEELLFFVEKIQRKDILKPMPTARPQ